MRSIWPVAQICLAEARRRRDYWAAVILIAVLSAAMGSVRVFGLAAMTRTVRDMTLLVGWTASVVIAVSFAARQIRSELERRTLMVLLAKPVSRWEVLLGKALGCGLSLAGGLSVFYIAFGILTWLQGEHLNLATYAQAAVLHMGMTIMVATLSLVGSLYMGPAANATVCYLVVSASLILGEHLRRLSMTLDGPERELGSVIYFLMPHLELFDLRALAVHNWPPIPMDVLAGILGYGFLYSAACLLIGYIGLRHKQL